MFLKTEKSRLVAESRPVCVGFTFKELTVAMSPPTTKSSGS